MADPGRLVEAAARLHPHLADALVFEQRPAFEHIHELQVAVVPVPLAMRRLGRPGAGWLVIKKETRKELAALL